MHRKTVHRWVGVLALVAITGVWGAPPAAAADLSDVRVMDRLTSLWSAVTAAPEALWASISGWLVGSAMEKTATQVDEGTPIGQTGTFGADPNGNE